MRLLQATVSLFLTWLLVWGTAASTSTEADGSNHPDAGTTTVVAPTSTTKVSRPLVHLVWASEGLSKELVESVEGVHPVASLVGGDVVLLDTERKGWFIPLDAIEIDPADHAEVWQDPVLADLRPGEVFLSESSAELRKMGAGAALQIEGHSFVVRAVVEDSVVGAAEVVFHREDENSPVITNRYLLVATDMTTGEFSSSIRKLDPELHFRIRSEGQVRFLRQGDAVAPQVMIKAALGEFAIDPGSGRTFREDDAFRKDNIVEADFPLLGRSKCHRVVVEQVEAAIKEVKEEGLEDLIDPNGYAGCWVSRFIGGNRGISRHAWGAAVDINAPDNLFGTAGDMDMRLVEIMERHGFTWGGRWLVPDPMHFEFVPEGFSP